MNVVKYKDFEIEYDDRLLDAVRHAYGKQPGEPVSEGEIIDFVKGSIEQAVNKGYAIYE